jgi:hypothetical protein
MPGTGASMIDLDIGANRVAIANPRLDWAIHL